MILLAANTCVVFAKLISLINLLLSLMLKITGRFLHNV